VYVCLLIDVSLNGSAHHAVEVSKVAPWLSGDEFLSEEAPTTPNKLNPFCSFAKIREEQHGIVLLM
jgi:hypothetical protein